MKDKGDAYYMMKECYADTVFINGKVITVDKEDSIKEAVAIINNKIAFVGSNKEVKDYIGENTKVIDINGKTLMPGFIDAHIHLIIFGLLDHGVINVDYNHVNSIEDIKKLIKEEVKNKKKGEWIVLSGYDHNKLLEKRHPTKEDFDEVAPDNPVQCIRCCPHMGVYNSQALKITGVTSPNLFAEGEVVVDENGEMTGLLKETAHMSLSKKVVFAEEDLIRGIKNANKIMIENGITSVHDAGSYGKDATRLLQKATLDKLIDIRVRPMIFDMFGKESGKEYIDDFLKTGLYTNIGNDSFKLGPVKIMTDGSTSGPSCATKEPYCHDPSLKGLQVWEQEEADEIVTKVHKAKYQMTAHAVGDKAVELMLNAYEKANDEYSVEDSRHRIEHCALTNDEIIKKIKQLKIIPVSNPAFITINGKDYNRFYGKRVNKMFPLKTYINEGIITAIGSDAPVTFPDPMFTIYGAINRMDIKTGEECGGIEKVDILDIIRMFTYNGAYVSFEEDIKGSIEEGKLADIVVLSEDILSYPKEKVMDIKVNMTMIDGKIVYERKGVL